MSINAELSTREFETAAFSKDQEFSPVRILEIELGEKLSHLPASDPDTGKLYRQARILIRLHTLPLGLIEIALPPEGLAPHQYVTAIWQNLADEINQHLKQDGLETLTSLGEEGLVFSQLPDCMQARARFLAKEAPFASIIVCTRDRADQLKTCLDSLAQLDYPSYEVVLVDNAPSSSATADLVLGQYSWVSQIRYVREDRPGLEWARNRGLREARGEIVVYTDDDVRIDRHWLTEIARGFSAAENVGCVGGLTLPGELETQPQEWFEQFSSFTVGFKPVINNIKTHRIEHPLYPYNTIGYGGGVNVAYRTSVLRKLGGFNPILGAGSLARAGGDIEAYLRVLARGYTSVYTPAALVYHFHRRDYAGLRKQVYNYGVGFICFLIQSIVDRPARFFLLARNFPRAVFALLSPNAPKHQAKKADYPKELAWLERKGMLYGPVAYFRSRLRRRQIIKQYGPIGK